MDALVILLLIIVLVVLITFRNYVTVCFKKIESDIQQLKFDIQRLKKIPPATIIEPSRAATEEVAGDKSKKTGEGYWQSSFKMVDEPIIPPIEKEKIVEEIVEENRKSEPITAGREVVSPVPIKIADPVRPVHVPRPSFFERNPDLEKFIGENLVSKIGIAILVLAIGFFVKFAIDNNWIGPVARVGIGLLCGGILVFLAHRMHHSYKAFSSVLVGGGLAIFYFTITLAYHQFHLFSQSTAFVIMIIITVFAVVLSILYDRQELAIIALVGGFAAPFLVSDGSGNYKVLFTYLIILNSGLLITAYNKSWRLLNLIAFIFTVLLFGGWLFSLSSNTPAGIYSNGIIFATVFYLLFFLINIANNIKENQRFIASDFSILLVNTGLFFAAGLYCLTAMNTPEYRGLFTILVGVFNLIASSFLFRKRKVDTNVLYLLIGITLTFISLAGPIQLHGNNITLFWASESVLLFWLFQKSKIRIIEYASLIVWSAMLLSLLMDWTNVYSNATSAIRIIVNKAFITGLYTAIASYLLFILRNKQLPGGDNSVERIMSKNVFRITGIVLLFFTGALEVNYQFTYYFPQFALNVLYLQLYTFVFVWLLLLITNTIETIRISARLQSILLALCVVYYLICVGLITSLQEHLLEGQKFTGYFTACWAAATLTGSFFYKLIQLERKNEVMSPGKTGLFVWLTCAGIIIFVSFEAFWIVNALFYNEQTPLDEIQKVFIKTCLPILWGICSFCFMWLGMKYKFKPLRIISLVLFLITLLKLFIFDISNIPAGGKIAAFFCLGVLLLIVSFMYQRLKNIIIRDEQNKPE